jgi:hypothetical protein
MKSQKHKLLPYIKYMASKIINLGSHDQKSLVECQPKGPPENLLEITTEPCEKMRDDLNWIQNAGNKKTGLGRSANDDPMLSGQIINDVNKPNRDVVYRYSKAQRGCDEAMLDTFKNISVIDEDGRGIRVPIIWGTQEKAVMVAIGENVRKDNSAVVDRIKLPIMAIHNTSLTFDEERYTYHRALDYMRRNRTDGKPGFTQNERYERDTVFGVARGLPFNIGYKLYVWTMYVEDMNQIVEQILNKTSPVGYVNVRGIPWEMMFKIDSTANNMAAEPADNNMRVVKFEFDFTLEAVIPQPIVRKKAILKTDVEMNVKNNLTGEYEKDMNIKTGEIK